METKQNVSTKLRHTACDENIDQFAIHGKTTYIIFKTTCLDLGFSKMIYATKNIFSFTATLGKFKGVKRNIQTSNLNYNFKLFFKFKI